MRRLFLALLLGLSVPHSDQAQTPPPLSPQETVPAGENSAQTGVADFYGLDQIGAKEVELIGDQIRWTFLPVSEQFFWCPGVRVQQTEKATVVTFVRCPTAESCAIDIDAPIGRSMIRTVAVPVTGKDLFVKNGEQKYKKIFDGKTRRLVQEQGATSNSSTTSEPPSKSKGSAKRSATKSSGKTNLASNSTPTGTASVGETPTESAGHALQSAPSVRRGAPLKKPQVILGPDQNGWLKNPNVSP